MHQLAVLLNVTYLLYYMCRCLGRVTYLSKSKSNSVVNSYDRNRCLPPNDSMSFLDLEWCVCCLTID